MAFAVVLSREGFAADGAHEGALVRVRAEVRAKVVGAGEAFGAERALEVGWVFLHAFGVAVGGGCAGSVGMRKFEDVVTVGEGGS